jgi:D-alanyl-D-alanine carboxypeptidase
MVNHAKKSLTCLGIVFFLCAFVTAFAQAQQPVWHDAVQQLLDSVRQRHELPGITATIIDPKGRSFDFASGVADTATGERLTPQHKLLSGSTGKMYFAISILLLAEQGKLQLDNKASTYLSGYSWYNALPNAAGITVRQLLNHTAGMEEYFLLGDFLTRLKQQPDKTWQMGELMAYMAGRTPLFAAGTSFGYADTHYLLLQQIIEHITGKNAYTFITENIIRPLRLQYTVPSVQREIPHLANGYSSPKLPAGFNGAMVRDGRLVINPQFEGGGGGFASNSHDLATLVYNLLYGKLLQPASLQQMKTPVPAKGLGPNNYYGLGLQIIINGSDSSFGHSGWFPGYVSDAELFTATGFTIAVQINTDFPRTGYLNPRQIVFALHRRLRN